jgi:hypothetical protein
MKKRDLGFRIWDLAAKMMSVMATVLMFQTAAAAELKCPG